MPETSPAVRRDRLRSLLTESQAEAALVTRMVNVRYLTGFTGSNAALLLTLEATVLATDGRYETQAAAQAPDTERVIRRDCAAALVERAAAQHVEHLAFEAHDVTVALHRSLTDTAGTMAMVDLGRAVEGLREVKDDAELALLTEACAISDRALADVMLQVRPGRTERDVAIELEAAMRAHGADGPAFETIVASGPNSAVPHHRPTDREIEQGDLLKIDFGACRGGYHADETRTFVVGAPPADWQREVYDLVARAQQAGRAALGPGVDVRDVDQAARAVIEDAGHAEHFPHGLGHGVGLEIHESPMIGHTATGRLAAGTPVTIEPGVYLPGRGGVRIEDTLVVRDGEPGLLTTTARELLVLG
ncbi:MAG: M24 family metallopeptidase [Actinomycetes bacterium]